MQIGIIRSNSNVGSTDRNGFVWMAPAAGYHLPGSESKLGFRPGGEEQGSAELPRRFSAGCQTSFQNLGGQWPQAVTKIKVQWAVVRQSEQDFELGFRRQMWKQAASERRRNRISLRPRISIRVIDQGLVCIAKSCQRRLIKDSG